MSDTDLTTAPAATEPKSPKAKTKPETGQAAAPAVPATSAVLPLPAYRPKPAGGPTLVVALAKATQTPPAVLAGLKAAYRWTDSTKMTRAEFIQKRDAWLSRPAKEV